MCQREVFLSVVPDGSALDPRPTPRCAQGYLLAELYSRLDRRDQHAAMPHPRPITTSNVVLKQVKATAPGQFQSALTYNLGGSSSLSSPPSSTALSSAATALPGSITTTAPWAHPPSALWKVQYMERLQDLVRRDQSLMRTSVFTLRHVLTGKLLVVHTCGGLDGRPVLQLYRGDERELLDAGAASVLSPSMAAANTPAGTASPTSALLTPLKIPSGVDSHSNIIPFFQVVHGGGGGGGVSGHVLACARSLTSRWCVSGPHRLPPSRSVFPPATMHEPAGVRHRRGE